MAFPTLNAQQGNANLSLPHYSLNCHKLLTNNNSNIFFVSHRLELNNRKILEDLQHKKQLILQKGVSPVVAGLPVNNAQITNCSMPLVEKFI